MPHREVSCAVDRRAAPSRRAGEESAMTGDDYLGRAVSLWEGRAPCTSGLHVTVVPPRLRQRLPFLPLSGVVPGESALGGGCPSSGKRGP